VVKICEGAAAPFGGGHRSNIAAAKSFQFVATAGQTVKLMLSKMLVVTGKETFHSHSFSRQ